MHTNLLTGSVQSSVKLHINTFINEVLHLVTNNVQLLTGT